MQYTNHKKTVQITPLLSRMYWWQWHDLR